jgi:hypothetical protein
MKSPFACAELSCSSFTSSRFKQCTSCSHRKHRWFYPVLLNKSNGPLLKQSSMCTEQLYFCMFHPCAGAEVRLTRSSRGRGGGKRSSLRVESRRPRGAARRSPAAQSVTESEAADAPDPLEGEVLGYFITIPGKPPR